MPDANQNALLLTQNGMQPTANDHLGVPLQSVAERTLDLPGNPGTQWGRCARLRPNPNC